MHIDVLDPCRPGRLRPDMTYELDWELNANYLLTPDRPEVTLSDWQDVKIQSINNYSCLPSSFNIIFSKPSSNVQWRMRQQWIRLLHRYSLHQHTIHHHAVYYYESGLLFSPKHLWSKFRAKLAIHTSLNAALHDTHWLWKKFFRSEEHQSI